MPKSYKYNPIYSLEKLLKAKNILMLHQEEIRERLKAAYWQELIHIQPAYLPHGFVTEWRKIRKLFTARPSVYCKTSNIQIVNSVKNTFYNMRKQRAVKIAQELILFSNRLEAYLDNQILKKQKRK